MNAKRLRRLGKAFKAKKELLEHRVAILTQQRNDVASDALATEHALDSPLVQSLSIHLGVAMRLVKFREQIASLELEIEATRRLIGQAHGLFRRLEIEVEQRASANEKALASTELTEVIGRGSESSPPQGLNG